MSPTEGFDCSGFVVCCLQALSRLHPTVLLPDGRHVNELFDRYGVLVHERLSLPGDMVFFSRNGILPTHVGFVWGLEGNIPTTFMHAPGVSDSRVEIAPIEHGSVPITDYQGRIYERNPIGYKRLTHRRPGDDPRYQMPIP